MKYDIPELDNNALRKFGFTTGAIVAVLFGLLLPWLLDHAFPVWPWYIAVPLWALAAVLPGSLKYVYITWMKIGHVLGWINTRIILAIVYYLFIFPMAMLLSLFGKDPMQRKIDKNMQSYRLQKEKRPDDHVERPF